MLYEKYTIKTTAIILSNGIIFRLHNLYYIDQINDIDRRARLINEKEGAQYHLKL
jgi:hypothetical protein